MARQQWEYMHVWKPGGADRAYVMASEGERELRPDLDRSGDDDQRNARLWAYIGQEGWELVAGHKDLLWFKRPIEPAE